MTNTVLVFLFIGAVLVGSSGAGACPLTNRDLEAQAIAELLSKDPGAIDNSFDQMRVEAARQAQTLPEFAGLTIVWIERVPGLMDGSTSFVVAGQSSAGWSGQLQDRTYAAVRIRDGKTLSLYTMDKDLVNDFMSAGYIK